MARDSVSSNDQDRYKTLIKELSKEDGKLISPIDLSLEITKPLILEPLKWINLDSVPTKMRITNSGETVIVSGKWSKDRPYLTGGPLDGNYVFSQIHFHWGEDEHEGSEHTVRGIRYPMEMHVMFFRSRYLTQEAALNHEDGLLAIVYLFKLQSKSSLGLRTLSSQLSKVIQPQTSTTLQPAPLSKLLVPFSEDYLMYCGAIGTQECTHSLMWLVARSAMAVATEDLDIFRTLLNSKKEPQIKNFREANPPMGRSVFHVCASENATHVLLPGCVEPPGQEILVGFAKVLPALDQTHAANVFSKGDGSDGELGVKVEERAILKGSKTNLPEKGQYETSNKCNLSKNNKTIPKLRKKSLVQVKIDCTDNISNKSACNKNEIIKLQKKDNAQSRKLFEKQRRDASPMPQNSFISAATKKRLQERIGNDGVAKKNVRTERNKSYVEKAVCVHTGASDSENPEPRPKITPSEHSPICYKPSGITRKPSVFINATSTCTPTTPPQRPFTGKALSRKVREYNNSRNMRSR